MLKDMDVVNQTVNFMRPAGYVAEAEYLMDRVAGAVDLYDRAFMRLRNTITNLIDFHQLQLKPLSLELSFLDEPVSTESEQTRIDQLCYSVEILRKNPKSLPGPPTQAIVGIVSIAQTLANAQKYRAALSVGWLAKVLVARWKGDLDLYLPDWDNLGLGNRIDTADIRERTPGIATLTRDLYSNGQYAACAALLTGTTRLLSPQEPEFAHIWSAFQETLPSSLLETQRSSDLQPHPVAERHVNAWIEDGDPPLETGRLYRFAVNIGKLRDQALGSSPFPILNWGDNAALAILIVVSGHGFTASPHQRQLDLPKYGETEPVLFNITPLEPNSFLLRISIYLARELTLLEEFEIPIAVKEAMKVA